MELVDRWEVTGVVMDQRQIKSKKPDSDWQMYILKIAGLGKAFEVQTEDVALYSRVALGEHVRCTGDFDFFNSIPKLVLREVESIDERRNKKTA